MNKHFFVLMYGTNEFEKNLTVFRSFHAVGEMVAVVQDWLEHDCGVDCVPVGQEDALRSANAGELPEMTFLCPEVREPADLEKYNGFYTYDSIGVFNLFITPVYDHKTAVKFRGGMIKEFGIDQDMSAESDEMMELLDTFVDSLEDETVDYHQAEEAIYRFLMQGGFSLFGSEADYEPDSMVEDTPGFHGMKGVPNPGMEGFSYPFGQ